MKRTVTIKLSTTNISDRGVPERAEVTVEIRRRDSVSPHKNVDLETCHRYTELSIVASVWYPGDRHDDPGSGGQCIDTVREHWGEDPCITELCAIWERWHLNGMTAGTRAQEEHLRAHPPEPPFYPESHFDKACKILKSADLYVDQGYSYGRAWLVEEIPADVLKRLGELCRDLGATIDVGGLDQ